jgi:hypothetical protein
MNPKNQNKTSVLPIEERRNTMNTQTRSKSSVRTKQSKFLFAFTICTWIVAASLSIYFYNTMRTDLSGSEWLGSPLFGLPLLVVLMTVYYFVARNKSIQPTVHGVVWSFFLFLVTTANMLTLAHFIFAVRKDFQFVVWGGFQFDGWKGFQFMPIMGAFQLLLIALGVHISLKEKSRGALFIFLTWTIVLSLLAASTVAFMTVAFHSDFGTLSIVLGPGLGVWIGVLLIAYFGFRSRFVSWLDALVGWAWSMCIGNSVSMLVAFIVLLKQGQLWSFYSIVGTFIFAILVTALRISARDRRKLISI